MCAGSKRDLPGFPRYSMIGNKEAGEYGLMIRAAQLDDDAEYQCQVSPAGGEPALIGTAQLSVLGEWRHLEHARELTAATCVSSRISIIVVIVTRG